MIIICNGISKAAISATTGGGLQARQLQVMHQEEPSSAQMIGDGAEL
jgi:hypothetical protein